MVKTKIFKILIVLSLVLLSIVSAWALTLSGRGIQVEDGFSLGIQRIFIPQKDKNNPVGTGFLTHEDTGGTAFKDTGGIVFKDL